MIGSCAIFGENCIDLVTAAWNTNKQDHYLNPKPIDLSQQSQCFQFLNPDDQTLVLAQQAKELEKLKLQNSNLEDYL